MSDEERESSHVDENPYAPPREPHTPKAAATTAAAGCLAAFCGFIACFTTCTGSLVLFGTSVVEMAFVGGVIAGSVVWWWVRNQLRRRASNAISQQDESATDG